MVLKKRSVFKRILLLPKFWAKMWKLHNGVKTFPKIIAIFQMTKILFKKYK